ncbi:MAG: enoyl-CoA hydratase-related protein [Deltaproteobacteria bacterium]|nr:enoyl-CoA hydratase-related protein [Deltaproteobacteria bacterium]
MNPVVTVQIDGPIARIEINRPEKLNALNRQVVKELAQAFAELESHPEIRVGILSGAGEKAFAAGADIVEMAEMGTEQARQFSRNGHQVGERIEHARFPVIARVQGFALGGGCELAMACDLIYASDRARFGQPEVSLGVIPGFGGTQRLARRVGVGKCRELVFRGHPIDGAEALRIHLIDGLFSADELVAKVDEIALQIAKHAPIAVSQAKRVMRAGHDVPLPVANELEVQAFGLCFGTEDQKSGMRAFNLDPRKPRTFEGR